MRKIPVTMATQHPDNAGPSIWTDKCFVSTNEEIEECYRCFSELGIDEYMWDWEGKFVDEAVIDRLYHDYHDYFEQNQIGKDKFLTFRIPNIWEETSHRLPRAFMNLISAEEAAGTYGMHTPPLFEVILPMTTQAEQLVYLQKRFSRIAHAAEDIFEMKTQMKRIDLIPLFEEIETMAESDKILETYIQFLQQEHDYKPEYMRVFIARSDPAMNAGLIPAMLACKHAISNYHTFGEKYDIKIFPWVGGGCLPFRGSINPENTEAVIEEYQGVNSLTIQSAFRFDYPLQDVKKAIAEFNFRIPQNLQKYRPISEEEGMAIKQFNLEAKGYYQETIESIANVINQVASFLPSHRERLQHIGIFGYSRGVGHVKLPRAIKFTGALYSLGVPPELIGTGRALKKAQEMKILPLVKSLYPNLKRDLLHAGHYLNRENLELLCHKNDAWKLIRQGIQEIEAVIEEPIGPKECHHMIHRNFTSNIFYKLSLGDDSSEDILQAARIRKSLG